MVGMVEMKRWNMLKIPMALTQGTPTQLFNSKAFHIFRIVLHDSISSELQKVAMYLNK